MSTKLFKNTEGKVLMSVGNKLIKQPYEFGLAFQNRMGLNNYILVSGLNLISDNYSVNLDFCRPLTISSTQDVFSAYNNSNQYLYTRFEGSTAVFSVVNNTNTFGVGQLLTNNFNPMTLSLGTDNLDLTYKLKNQNQSINNIYTGKNNPENTVFDKILIGKNYASNTNYLNSGFWINRCVIKNRSINNSEFLYHYNNALFNEYQDSEHYIDLRFNVAEVINIEGVDQPCIRDYSGNNHHGIIMNLPAGTAQQKVDYANANLFVPFQ